MSRSIHTTHKELEYQKRFINADKEKIEKLDMELSKKRYFKEQKKRIRENEKTKAPAVSPESIPIYIEDESD